MPLAQWVLLVQTQLFLALLAQQVQLERQAQQEPQAQLQPCQAQLVPQVQRALLAQLGLQAHKESKVQREPQARRVPLAQTAALPACLIFQQTRLRRRETLALAISVGTTPLRSTLLHF